MTDCIAKQVLDSYTRGKFGLPEGEVATIKTSSEVSYITFSDGSELAMMITQPMGRDSVHLAYSPAGQTPEKSFAPHATKDAAAASGSIANFIYALISVLVIGFTFYHGALAYLRAGH